MKFTKKIQELLPKGSFARNVVTLMTGTTFAQALAILVSPILTRLYSPSDFGVYALYTSILGILSTLACWRYEMAIVVPAKDEDGASLLALSVIICSFMAALTGVLVALLRNPFAQLFNAPELARWLWFLPVSLIAAGLFQAINYWSTRRKLFKLLAMRQITRSSVTVTTQFIAGFSIHGGPIGLIAGSILGQVVATLRLACVTWANDHKYIIQALSIKNLRVTAGLYKRFPLYLGLAGLMNIASSEIPLILMGYYFNPTIVGFFVLGRRVVEMPLTVIQGAVTQVFFPEASDAFRDGRLSSIVFATFSKLIDFILVPILLLIISGPDLISVIFGNEWRIAGVFLVWMAPRILVQFISSPLSSIFLVLNRQDLNLRIDTMLFVSNIGFVVIGGLLNSYIFAIQLLGVGTFICYSIACLLIFKVAGITYCEIFKKVAKSILRAVPYLILPLSAVLLLNRAELTVIISVMCGCLFLIFNAREFITVKPK